MEVENTYDDEQPHVEVVPQPLDDYPSVPHDVYVLEHVAYHMFEGVVRFLQL